MTVAPIGRSERLGTVRRRELEGVFTGELAAVGSDFGQLAVAAGAEGEVVSAGAGTEVLQGSATHALGSPAVVAAGLPSVLARAYLGDVAIATVGPGQIDVRVERWDQRGFHPRRVVPVGPGPVTALAVTMDYRSDLLLAWEQSGSIFARVLRARGGAQPTQLLGSSAPEPQLQASLSDNNHGMVAWSSTAPAGSGGASTPVTSTYIDISAAGVRFGAPATVATYADPAEVGKSAGSLALVRLADENVQMAWTTAEYGHYVVRSSAAVYASSSVTTLLSNPDEDAVLADLAAGPANEAIALWTNGPRQASSFQSVPSQPLPSTPWESTTPPAAPPEPTQSELWEARTSVAPRDRVVLTPPEVVAPAGPIADPTLAIDPRNDDAVAAWSLVRDDPSVEYSVGQGVSGYRPRAPSAARRVAISAGEWMRVALAGASAAQRALSAISGLTRPRRSLSGGEGLAQEADGPLPRELRLLGVVGAEPVGVVEEGVSGALVVIEPHIDTGLAELCLERMGGAQRDEFVRGAEVAENGAVDGVEVGLSVGHHVVVGDGCLYLGAGGGRPYGQAPSETEADRCHPVALDAGKREQVLGGAAHVLLGLVHRHGHHLLFGLARLSGGLAAIEVGREREEALIGEAIADRANVIVELPTTPAGRSSRDRARRRVRPGSRELCRRWS